MLLTRNRVYTAYELGFTPCGVVAVIPAMTYHVAGRNMVVAGRNLCRQKLFSEPYLKGTRPEQFLILSVRPKP